MTLLTSPPHTPFLSFSFIIVHVSLFDFVSETVFVVVLFQLKAWLPTASTGDYERFKHEGTEVTVSVADVIPHPNYNPMTLDNDIGLLRLEAPVKFSNFILPACLPSRGLAEGVLHLNGTTTVVTGWGKLNETSRRYSSALNFIQIPLVNHSLCSQQMMNSVSENVLCAGILGDIKDACEGDSGGPMMVEYRKTWFLIGLVSWGEGCGHKDKLGIYTKVSNYLEWIDRVRQKFE